jgi:4-hydroxy-2-oxoheptanedioate aldolase
MTISITGTHRYAQKLSAGEPALACFNIIPDPTTAEALSFAGFDIVIVDLQHGQATLHDLPNFVRAIDAHGAAPFARTPWSAPQDIMRAVDAGAVGIIIPMIETPEQARLAAEAARYPGRGNRSFGPVRPGLRDTEYANSIVHVYPMIETGAALESVDEIAAIEGVDGLFVGPVDLGLSMGIPALKAMTHPDVAAGIDTCIAAARKYGKIVGVPALNEEHARELIAKGAGWVSIGDDRKFVREAGAAALKPWTAR